MHVKAQALAVPRQTAFKLYFQSRRGRAIFFEVRIARTRSGDENCRGLVTRKGEVGRVGGFGVERALRKHARLSVVGLFAVAEVPFAGDNRCKPIIAVSVRRDVCMRGYLELCELEPFLSLGVKVDSGLILGHPAAPR